MEEQLNPSVLTEQQHPLLEASRQRVYALVHTHQDARLVLHDDHLADYLHERVRTFANQEQASADEALAAQIAALFYPIGFRIDFQHPQAHSQQAAREFLQQQKTDQPLLAAVELALAEVFRRQPASLPARLLSDALTGTICGDELASWPALRQLERELFNGPMDRLEQAQLHLQELLNIRHQTQAGRRYWQTRIGQQLVEQKKRVEKLVRSQGQAVDRHHTDDPPPFSQLERGVPTRAAQTFFRAIYRNHINLSAIADNKANIMISVNAILISVLITFLSYRNIAETQPMILLPVVIFLVVGLSSLVFAVLSARPKVTRLSPPSDAQGGQNRGLAFFGNFVHMDVDTFEEQMNDVLNDSHLVYSNMVRDLYHLGKVLDKKYNYLSIAYNIFMVGLIVTVILFLFALFYPTITG